MRRETDQFSDVPSDPMFHSNDLCAPLYLFRNLMPDDDVNPTSIPEKRPDGTPNPDRPLALAFFKVMQEKLEVRRQEEARQQEEQRRSLHATLCQIVEATTSQKKELTCAPNPQSLRRTAHASSPEAIDMDIEVMTTSSAVSSAITPLGTSYYPYTGTFGAYASHQQLSCAPMHHHMAAPSPNQSASMPLVPGPPRNTALPHVITLHQMTSSANCCSSCSSLLGNSNKASLGQLERRKKTARMKICHHYNQKSYISVVPMYVC